MPQYALGTARLSAEAPPSPGPFPGPEMDAWYALRPPSALVLPSSEEAWEEAYGGTSPPEYVPLPTAIYSCTEQVGKLLDCLHPDDDERWLTPEGGPLQGRRAVGLATADAYGAVLVHPERGVELCADGQRFCAPGTSAFGNPDTDEVALLVVYRVRRVDAGAERGIIAKHDDDSGGEGYTLGVDGEGRATFHVVGSTSPVIEADVSSVESVADGAWHCSLVVIERDLVAGKAFVHHYSDAGNGTMVELEGAPDFDSQVPFRVGASEGWPAARCQVAYAAFWKFAPDESEYDVLRDGAALETFWTAFRPDMNRVDPPGGELEVTHESATGWIVGVNPYGTGNVVAKYGSGQVPYGVLGDAGVDAGGYPANYSVGDAAPDGMRDNLLTDTERFAAGWITQGGEVDVVSGAADAPDGMRGSARVTYQGSGYLYQDVTFGSGSPANKSGSVWIRFHEGNDPAALVAVGGRFVYGEHPEHFETVPVSKLAQGRWVRIDKAYPDESEGSSGLSIYVQTTGEVVLDLWGAQLTPKSYPGPYCPAFDEAVNVGGSTLGIENLSPSLPFPLADEGRVELKMRFPYEVGIAEGRSLCVLQGQASGDDVEIWLTRDAHLSSPSRIILEITKDSLTWAQLVSLQATGLLEGQTVEDAAEVVIAFGWRFNLPGAWLQVNGVAAEVVVQPAGDFTGFVAEALCVGHDGNGDGQPDAPMYDLTIWSQ
jgi:hypothetical protein